MYLHIPNSIIMIDFSSLFVYLWFLVHSVYAGLHVLVFMGSCGINPLHMKNNDMRMFS